MYFLDRDVVSIYKPSGIARVYLRDASEAQGEGTASGRAIDKSSEEIIRDCMKQIGFVVEVVTLPVRCLFCGIGGKKPGQCPIPW